MDENKSILDRLMNGDKVDCPQCHEAIIEPFGTTADKAHSFICPNCDYTVRYTPAINIE